MNSNDYAACSPLFQTLEMLSCNVFGIIHQMMHVLGFGHEHNRPDRNKYVTVNETLLELENAPWWKSMATLI